MRTFHRFIVSSTFVLLAGIPALAGQKSPSTAPATQPATFELRVLHVNDVHGQTQERTAGRASVGGYARLATAVADVRKATGGNVLLLHAGDELSRSDELTRKTLGLANIAIFNELKFDAMTPGNGEFYDGVPNLRTLMAKASFPLLTANVLERVTGKHLGKPYVIKKIGPVKVAILGLCFVRVQHPLAWPLKLVDPVETAKAMVPQLRKQADVVIVLSHIGADEDVRLASQVGGIDLIIGAHSHTTLPRGRQQKDPDGKNVLICQAGDLLRFMGRVKLTLTREGDGYRVTSALASLTPLDAKVRQDPKIKALIARLWASAVKPKETPAKAVPKQPEVLQPAK